MPAERIDCRSRKALDAGAAALLNAGWGNTMEPSVYAIDALVAEIEDGRPLWPSATLIDVVLGCLVSRYGWEAVFERAKRARPTATSPG